MLFFKDITAVWNKLSLHDLFFASRILDYKGRIIHDQKNRAAFKENKLPNVYFALQYFKKTELTFSFYKMLEFVVHNWQACYGKYAPLEYQDWLSMDVSAAIAIKLLDIESQVTNSNIDFDFVHMKANVQGWRPVPDSWVDSSLNYVTDDLDLYINQFKQREIFHYTENKFLTDSLLNLLESKYDN